jgi:hypothetical protein
MRFVIRDVQPALLEAARSFPAVVLTGPRRTGKTTLLRRLYPHARYVLLEDPDIQSRARSDPRALIEELRAPVLFDEIQNAPDLLAYIRTRVDRKPRATGQWLFTGSQEAPLMQGVSESMAGRAAILQLLPFSLGETDRVSLLHGGYPEVLARPASRGLWFSSYIQTYLERDVRAIVNVRDLPTFRRFLALLASRHGQILNKTDLAAPLGLSVPTIGDWLHVLEITGQIMLVPPYFENFGKRLVKSPKNLPGGLGAGVLPARDRHTSRVGTVALSRRSIRRIRGRGDPEEPGEPRRAQRAVPFSRSAGPRSGFPLSVRRWRSVDGGMQSVQDGPSGHGGTYGVLAPFDGRAQARPDDCGASRVGHRDAEPGDSAGSGGAGRAGICRGA